MKLSKILSLLLVFVMLAAMGAGLAESEPVVLDLFCHVDDSRCTDPSNLYWWKYAEYRLAEQGYNIKLNVSGASGEEANLALSQRLGSNNLPDIMFGFTLTGPDIVLYGDGDGMLLDITPYLNEDDMPFAYECSITNGADAFASSVSPAGKIYGMPYVVDRTMGWLAGTANNQQIFVNMEKLEELGKEMPTTGEDLLDVLRAAKDTFEGKDGKEFIPFLANNGGTLNNLSLGYFGFYGTKQTFGETFAVKDGEIAIPAYTAEYKDFLEFYNTLFTEELIPSEFFTMDGDTFKATAADENFLMIAAHPNTFTNAPDVYLKYQCLAPIQMYEDVKPVVAATVPYTCNRVWASAQTEHPEEVCKFFDLLYDDEAIVHLVLGPVESDPVGIMEYTWLANEDNSDIYHPLIGADKPYTSSNDYEFQLLIPCGLVGDMSNYNLYSKTQMAHTTFSLKYDEYTDCVTGEKVTLTNKSGYGEKYKTNVDSFSRIQCYKAWENNLTVVFPAMLYCSAEDSIRITDLSAVINAYVEENFAQFVSGLRSLDEFDAFEKELESMGIEELLELYQAGYAPYIDSIFG